MRANAVGLGGTDEPLVVGFAENHRYSETHLPIWLSFHMEGQVFSEDDDRTGGRDSTNLGLDDGHVGWQDVFI